MNFKKLHKIGYSVELLLIVCVSMEVRTDLVLFLKDHDTANQVIKKYVVLRV